MQGFDNGLHGMHEPDNRTSDEVANLHRVQAFAHHRPPTAQDLHPAQTLDEDGLSGVSPPFGSCTRCRPVRRQASRR